MTFRQSGDERGVALVAVMTASTLLLALGVSLAMTTDGGDRALPPTIATPSTLHAADAAVEFAIGELAAVADWDAVLGGVRDVVVPRRVPAAVALPDGSILDLAARAVCCAAARAVAAATATWTSRPRTVRGDGTTRDGRSTPRAALARLLRSAVPATRAYVVVWVADDPSENDAQPLRDGGPPAAVNGANLVNPGRGAIWLHASAYGPSGSRRTVEAVVERDSRLPPARVRVRTWREVT